LSREESTPHRAHQFGESFVALLQMRHAQSGDAQMLNIPGYRLRVRDAPDPAGQPL
jgi:hypothetical protein